MSGPSNPIRQEEAADLERRAEEQLKLAQRASDPETVARHYELACRYLDMLHPGKGEDESRRRSPSDD